MVPYLPPFLVLCDVERVPFPLLVLCTSILLNSVQPMIL